MGTWVDINEIVSAYLDENELSNNNRFKLWQLAFRGMEQLGLDYFFRVQSFKLDINANQTVSIPPESINVLKVGVFGCAGEIVAFVENDRLSNYKDMFATEDSLTYIGGYDMACYAFCNYWDGYALGNVYCSNVPCYAGQVKINKEAAIITLSNFSSLGYVMVECVVAPEENGEYRIPVQFKQPLISFMDWKNLPKNAKGTGIWRTMKNDFFNERRLAVARYKQFKLSNTHYKYGYTF